MVLFYLGPRGVRFLLMHGGEDEKHDQCNTSLLQLGDYGSALRLTSVRKVLKQGETCSQVGWVWHWYQFAFTWGSFACPFDSSASCLLFFGWNFVVTVTVCVILQHILNFMNQVVLNLCIKTCGIYIWSWWSTIRVSFQIDTQLKVWTCSSNSFCYYTQISGFWG